MSLPRDDELATMGRDCHRDAALPARGKPPRPAQSVAANPGTPTRPSGKADAARSTEPMIVACPSNRVIVPTNYR